MKSKIIKCILFGLIFAAGIVLLLNSVKLGYNEFHVMSDDDFNTHLALTVQAITKYRWLGIILSFLGGLGVLMNLNETNHK